MKNFLRLCAVLAGVFLLGSGGCESPLRESPSVAESIGTAELVKIRQEIQALETDLGKATTNGDLDALLEYYANDAVSLPADAPMLVGKTAIGAHYKKHVIGNRNTHAYRTIDVFAAGNLVVETGESTVTDTSGKASTGKYMALYEKRNGQYVCLRESYNNDAPTR